MQSRSKCFGFADRQLLEEDRCIERLRAVSVLTNDDFIEQAYGVYI